MPFTPFHMGPRLAIKAVAGHHFSLTVFGIAQVAMDIEPLIHLERGDAIVHGFTHTYLGATLIGLASIVAGRPMAQCLLERWAPPPIRSTERISWTAATSGALAGTLSHVLLDSLLHADMSPFAPVSTTNEMLGALSPTSVHLFCVVSGWVGALLWFHGHLRRLGPIARSR